MIGCPTFWKLSSSSKALLFSIGSVKHIFLGGLSLLQGQKLDRVKYLLVKRHHCQILKDLVLPVQTFVESHWRNKLSFSCPSPSNSFFSSLYTLLFTFVCACFILICCFLFVLLCQNVRPIHMELAESVVWTRRAGV